jgi:hypothetical protein
MLAIDGNEIFGVADAVEQRKFNIKYYPGKEILGDYQSKHHKGIYTNQRVSVNSHELTNQAL